MTAVKELGELAQRMGEIKGRFTRSSTQYAAPHEDEIAFEGFLTEGKAIVIEALGPASQFRFKLDEIERSMHSNFYGGPSYNDVGTAIVVLEGAARHLQRQQVGTGGAQPTQLATYVDPGRIRAFQTASGKSWDTARLVQLCIELNNACASSSYMTVAMLVRSIVDHVPPVFGFDTFAGVANNYAGSKSFRASMQHLDRSLRNIADSHLHTHIRKRETLPNATQVDFRADLDVLLAELERVISDG